VAREVVVPINGIVVDWGGATGLCNVCHADWLAAYDWHLPGFCDGCQTCHNHGHAWDSADWGPTPADDTPCPFGVRSDGEPNGQIAPWSPSGEFPMDLPPHLGQVRRSLRQGDGHGKVPGFGGQAQQFNVPVEMPAAGKRD
jgi:hypothetical protein